jgi:hypothetical protein
MLELTNEERDAIEKRIREVLNNNPIWKPGVTEVIKEAEKKYYSDVILSPSFNAQDILNNADKEIKNIENKKSLFYDDISYLESATSALLMENDVRKHYDILKTSIIITGEEHNIAILIPKGNKLAEIKLNELPKNSLIVDSLGRSIGNSAAKTLATSPEDYYNKDDLYPMIVNYNSAAEQNLEETINKFLEVQKKQMIKILQEFKLVQAFFAFFKEKGDKFKEKTVDAFIKHFDEITREHYQFLAPFFTMNLLIPGKNFIKSSII